jgi:thioredoxin 2
VTTRMSQNSGARTKHVTLQCQFCSTWNRIDISRAKDRPKCGQCSRPLLLDRPYPLTDDSFARTIAESEVPVIVDFYADWCGPCKMMAPSVDALAAKNIGRALVAKLNTDFNAKTAQGHQIQGIPTTMVFNANALVSRQSGALPMNVLEEMLETALHSSPDAD